jgi:hypothetical protein
MPCNFCSSRGIREPCFKLYGPKKESLLAPSRPIPTAIDDVLDGKEVLWLQYFYSRRNQCMEGALIGKLAARYGAALPRASVRYAVLALASWYICKESCANYYGLALRKLHRRLNGQSALSSADLVAGILLAHLAWVTSGENSLDEVHVLLCLSIMKSTPTDGDMDLLYDIFDWLELLLALIPSEKRLKCHTKDSQLRTTLLGNAGFRPTSALSMSLRSDWLSAISPVFFRLQRYLTCLMFAATRRLEEELFGFERDTSLWSECHTFDSNLRHGFFRNAISAAAKWAPSTQRIGLLHV